MPLVPDSPEQEETPITPRGRRLSFAFLHLPRNVYILLCFTLGKGFQLSIATLTVNYYAHSLGYRQDFVGVLSAMPAIGSLAAAVPIGFLADRLGRKKNPDRHGYPDADVPGWYWTGDERALATDLRLYAGSRFHGVLGHESSVADRKHHRAAARRRLRAQ